MRHFTCPKCGGDISETYEHAEPDVGIMSSGWYCGQCDESFIDENEGDDFDLDRA